MQQFIKIISMNKNLFYCLLVSLLFIATSCSSSYSKSDPSINSTNIEEAALAAAQNFIREKFAPYAAFQASNVIIEPTSVDNRFKIIQWFYTNNKSFVYRIYVQKFPTGWEYGLLTIEREGVGVVYNSNGQMKSKEYEESTQTESRSASGVPYTIILRKGKNVVRVYTPSRLGRDEILKIYNDLKDQYEQVQFSQSSDPNDDEYLAILSGMVIEFDTDKTTILTEY